MEGSLSRRDKVEANLTRARQIAASLSRQGRLSGVLSQIFPELDANTLYAGLLTSSSVLSVPELRGVLAATLLGGAGTQLAPELQGRLVAALLASSPQLFTPDGWIADWAAGILVSETQLLSPSLQGQLAAALLASSSALQEAAMGGRMVASILNSSTGFVSATLEGALLVGLLSSSTSLLVAVVSGKLVASLLSSTSQLLAHTLEEVAGGTVVYTSDFSAGVDGWSGSNGAVTGNIDSIGGQDDNLRFTGNINVTRHYPQRDLGVTTGGPTYTITGDIYIPSSNSNTIQVDVTGFGAGTNVDFVTTLDAWTSFYLEYVPSSTFLQLRCNNGSTQFYNANGDPIYVRNVIVTEL